DGSVYAAWSEHANGHGVVRLTTSRDGGASWSVSVVAGDVPGRSAFFSSLAVDPQGVIAVGFLAVDDRAAGTPPGPGVASYDAYLTSSHDGGTTFSTPALVTKVSSDPDGSSLNSLSQQFLGDYVS